MRVTLTPEQFRDLDTFLVYSITATIAVGAFLAWHVFTAYGIRRAVLLIVIGWVIRAGSWAFFSGGTQSLVPEPSELRNWLILGGLATKQLGEILVVVGLFDLAIELQRRRRHARGKPTTRTEPSHSDSTSRRNG